MKAYTIGTQLSYDDHLCTSPETLFKMGATDKYDGGWIWKTIKDAINYAEIMTKRSGGILYAVYEVELAYPWEACVSKKRNKNDGIHRLLHHSKINKRVWPLLKRAHHG